MVLRCCSTIPISLCAVLDKFFGALRTDLSIRPFALAISMSLWLSLSLWLSRTHTLARLCAVGVCAEVFGVAGTDTLALFGI